METPSYVEIQRRHVEESRKWPDLRAYAAEVLRRHEANKSSKSRKGATSQHVPAPRRTNFAAQETRRPTVTGRADVLVAGGKSISQANMSSHDTACQRPGIIAPQENAVCNAIPDDGMFQRMRASSHAPGVTNFTAVEEANPWATRENDGQGMDEASFQKLLAAIRNAQPVVPNPQDASVTPGAVTTSIPCHAMCHTGGIPNPDSRFADSRLNGCNKPENHAPPFNSERIEQGVSFKLASIGSNTAAVNGKLNISRMEPTSDVITGKKSQVKHSNGISSGISKQRKPEKAFGRKYSRKVHGRRENGQMPDACRKTDVGCQLCFASRSPDCPHLKNGARAAVPIPRTEASAVATPTAAIATEDTVSGQNASPFLSSKLGTSFNQNSGSRLPGVSKNGRIQKASTRKQGRERKDSSAVAARQWNAQELAQLCAAAQNKTSSQATAMYAPEKSVGARGGIIPQLDSVQPTSCNAPEVDIDLNDTSLIPEVERSNPRGLSKAEVNLFKRMFVNVPDHLAFSMLDDLPPPEEFFRET